MTQEEKIRLIAEKVMGWEMAIRWCSHNPECGGYEEIESLFREGGYSGLDAAYYREHADEIEAEEGACQRRRLLCRKEISTRDDGTTWETWIPEWNPYENDADCLQVLRRFSAYRITELKETMVCLYGSLGHFGYPILAELRISRKGEPDPAQRFRTCICEAAIKTIEGR